MKPGNHRDWRRMTQEFAVAPRWTLLFVLCAGVALGLTGARSGALRRLTHQAHAAEVPTRAAAAATSSANGVAPSISIEPFAIADFDGDRRPDLAQVESGQGTSYRTQYWIQLQLTRAGPQLIGVIAPAGGLQLRVSDVNGDHAIDLVLSTAWLNRPVAILLNDGHGRFTAEKPSAFPGAFRSGPSQRVSQRTSPHGAASATQSRPGMYVEIASAQLVPQTRAHTALSSAILVSTRLLKHRGRAPPSLI